MILMSSLVIIFIIGTAGSIEIEYDAENATSRVSQVISFYSIRT